jgi:hypothetical protein
VKQVKLNIFLGITIELVRQVTSVLNFTKEVNFRGQQWGVQIEIEEMRMKEFVEKRWQRCLNITLTASAKDENSNVKNEDMDLKEEESKKELTSDKIELTSEKIAGMREKTSVGLTSENVEKMEGLNTENSERLTAEKAEGLTTGKSESLTVEKSAELTLEKSEGLKVEKSDGLTAEDLRRITEKMVDKMELLRDCWQQLAVGL